jgi:long-chain acyl-CoA synthetase
MEESFIQYIEESIRNHWNLAALTDFKGETSSYKDVARKIEKLHLLFEYSGVERGDKIALCSRNTSNWGIAFLATLTYGAVAVPILNEFKAEAVHHIVNHSEAKLLFAGDVVWENLEAEAMPNVDGILRIEDYSLRVSRKERLTEARARLNELFGQKFPDRFRPEDVHYRRDRLEELALINYTSGTTSLSKGVMLPYRSLWANLKFALGVFGELPGENMVSMLPMAHMYGLAFEFIYEFVSGIHVHFLSRTPSPKVVADAFAEVKPNLIIAVPLIIEKIIKKKVFPTIEKPHMKLLMSIPLINEKIRETIRQKVMDAFGGNFKELIIGGAALNQEVEKFLRSIRFPYTVGYGMTECGPILSYDGWRTFKQGSCGKAVPRMELRIDSRDPQHEVGEILAKGDCVMDGYYKNEEATREALDNEGWLHTGDMGVIDSDGYLYIRGRCKNMILSANGQNIYPEEIEDKLNNMPFVSESIVVDRKGKLVALVVPDADQVETEKLTENQLAETMAENLKELNRQLPAYSQLSSYELFREEFEKTPKRSIKRFLYK